MSRATLRRAPLYSGPVFSVALSGSLGRVCQRRLLKTAAFHSRSTITGTQACLVAPQAGEPLQHPSLTTLKAIWLLVAAGIRADSLTRTQLARKTSGTWGGGAAVWEERGTWEAPPSLGVHEECSACGCFGPIRSKLK